MVEFNISKKREMGNMLYEECFYAWHEEHITK